MRVFPWWKLQTLERPPHSQESLEFPSSFDTSCWHSWTGRCWSQSAVEWNEKFKRKKTRKKCQDKLTISVDIEARYERSAIVMWLPAKYSKPSRKFCQKKIKFLSRRMKSRSKDRKKKVRNLPREPSKLSSNSLYVGR